jgi:hypothetical protein
MGCSSSKIDGTQSAGEHLPALQISGVSAIDVRNLTIAAAGEGTTCGQNTGDEIGLDLQDVSNSTFENLCFEENGVTELRVYGNSDGNLFRNVSIDGMTRLFDGTDECGHRSREGVLIDGGATCEGGAGAIADGNRFENLTVENVTHGFYVKLADDTEIDSNTVSASPAPAWLDGASSFGLVVEMADRTQVLGNQIGGSDTVDGVRVAGRPAGSCVTERTDTVGTVLKDNTIENVSGAGLHLFKAADDPGVPIDTLIECNDFFANGTGVLVDHVGSTTPNRMHLNDVRANGEGVRNTAVGTLPAEDNFWNASDGPSGAGGGSGDSVFGSVDFTPWLEGSAFEDNDLDGYSECEGDCDDQDDQLSPGVEETCDGIDNDCDGSIDEDLPLNTYYRDSDGDGFGDPNDTVEDCSDTPPSGYVANGDDCDDTNPDIYPDAPEVTCDGIDQGCDGNDDEAPDGDGDGYDVCDPADPADGDGLAADCDDTADTVNPGQSETICDGVDNDCDAGSPDAPDEDADGADVCDVDDPNNPDGVGPDCDDNDPNRSPLENEICDDVDNDCDGSVDEDLPLNTFYADGDGDGYGVPEDTIEDCASTPPAGYADNPDDCDDTDPDVNPAATEVCTDDVDNDCDGSADGNDTTCSGLSVSDLAFASGSKSTLTWTAASAADSHALYRGMIPAAGFAGYDHLCEASEVAGSSAEDPDAPIPGDSYYYLATGLDVDPGTGEIVGGPLGTSSQGGSRADSGTISCGPRVYVDPDAAGAGDGLSWADAYTTVSEALAHDRASDRGLEVWVTGNITDDPASLTSGTRAGARLLGGFAGTETSAWARDPDITPSTWDGGGSAVLLDADGVSVVVDGLRMENAGTGVRANIAGQRIELVGGRFASFTDRAADVDATSGGTLWVTGSRFDASGQHAVRAVVRGGTLDGWIHDNVFDGGSDAAVRLEARASTQDAIHDVSVVGNEIRGGAIGLALGAHGDEASALSRQSSLIASNLIHGTSGEAVRVEASGSYATETAASTTESVPLLIGNTLSDGSAAGLVCSATRTDSTADPSLHQVRAVPEVWNNLVTFFGGIGIEESEDDEATNLVSDPTVVRNDLFGNAGPYRDEGVDDLADVGAVNALSEARDNIAEDPLYVDRANADFHLDAASPVIDQADGASPPGAARDIDGETRSKDGDGDGTARPDLGADER